MKDLIELLEKCDTIESVFKKLKDFDLTIHNISEVYSFKSKSPKVDYTIIECKHDGIKKQLIHPYKATIVYELLADFW